MRNGRDRGIGVDGMTILVFGSLNMDLIAQTSRFPMVGETLMGRSFATLPGGKGANQAVAVARLGVPAVMVGRVGPDGFGRDLLASLQMAGVDTSAVRVDASTHSGVAMITVDDRAENHILVIPGANGRVDGSDVEQVKIRLAGASALLLQLEVPLPAVLAAAQAARSAGIPVILDPAPAQADLPQELYACVDILTPNEVEAAQLVGFPIEGPQAWTQAAMMLRDRGVATVLIKLGAQGVFCATAGENFFIPAFPVHAVDTVAAGDIFNGGLAAGLAQGKSLRQAVTWGVAAAALSVTRPGAQSSMPDRPTFEAFLAAKNIT
ncbi:MAG: ribokinase [Leptolyngbyaceae cyanobacterium bins.59]|nr:ribokinase [Leptolyngbyaceae cyanobacterium bins.59]